jgi:N6-L-threonylcarbamoyladenine synthase
MEAPDVRYPYLVLIASGGHSSLVIVDSPGHFREIGRTRDDAAGEALDKVGKLIGLEYPAGPQLDRLGFSGRSDTIAFHARLTGRATTSFSGVKLLRLRTGAIAVRGVNPKSAFPDWAASFESAVMMRSSTISFIKQLLRINTISVAGGVAQSPPAQQRASGPSVRIAAVVTRGEWCADNARSLRSPSIRLRATPFSAGCDAQLGTGHPLPART